MTEQPTDHDDTDVPEALKRETQDGPGDLSKLPEPDFESFATEGVEVTE